MWIDLSGRDTDVIPSLSLILMARASKETTEINSLKEREYLQLTQRCE